MRSIIKFYTYIKSTYLNNSKHSNNLRHFLRIFFEREVKSRELHTAFGFLFKGSKWSDYKTYNINKLLIKSYFIYLLYFLIFFFVVCLFLGRSKAEYYFGFAFLMGYINFILGYLVLCLGDF